MDEQSETTWKRWYKIEQTNIMGCLLGFPLKGVPYPSPFEGGHKFKEKLNQKKKFK